MANEVKGAQLKAQQTASSMQRQERVSAPSRWAKMLIPSTLLLVGLAMGASAAGNSKKTQKPKETPTATILDISTAAWISHEGVQHWIELKTCPTCTYVNGYSDGKFVGKISLRKTINDGFDAKYTIRGLHIGNPSFLVDGLSSEGYGDLISTAILGESAKIFAVEDKVEVEKYESAGGKREINFNNGRWKCVFKYKGKILGFIEREGITGKVVDAEVEKLNLFLEQLK